MNFQYQASTCYYLKIRDQYDTPVIGQGATMNFSQFKNYFGNKIWMKDGKTNKRGS